MLLENQVLWLIARPVEAIHDLLCSPLSSFHADILEPRRIRIPSSLREPHRKCDLSLPHRLPKMPLRRPSRIPLPNDVSARPLRTSNAPSCGPYPPQRNVGGPTAPLSRPPL